MSMVLPGQFLEKLLHISLHFCVPNHVGVLVIHEFLVDEVAFLFDGLNIPL